MILSKPVQYSDWLDFKLHLNQVTMQSIKADYGLELPVGYSSYRSHSHLIQADYAAVPRSRAHLSCPNAVHDT